MCAGFAGVPLAVEFRNREWAKLLLIAFNNHRRRQAVQNARELRALLAGA